MSSEKFLNPSYVITVYHTCRSQGTKEFIEKNAPFLAKVSDKNNVDQFLGAGYYFWDDHIEMAHIWGEEHYHGKYTIVESSVYIGIDSCFDLVGCRKHMNYLIELERNLLSMNIKKKSQWQIGELIDFITSLEEPKLFPYKCIRAVDHLAPQTLEQNKKKFVNNNKHFTILSPKIALCVLDKSVLLRPISIIYPN